MIPVDDHRARILAAMKALPATTVPLADASTLAPAADVRSRWDLPLFDASAMDGYAVRRADAVVGTVLRVVADLPAGSSDDPPLGDGEAARIMTGAPVPTAADAVVPLEHTDLGTAVRPAAPERVTVLTAPLPGAHIRRAGEDRAAGDVVVGAGTRLGAWQLSAIASSGYDEVLVHTAPRVAVISTGSELIAQAAMPGRGQIPESNSVLLSAAVAEAGGTVSMRRTVPDDAELLRAAVREALSASDAIVLTGGASVGSFDVVRAVLAAEYGIRFENVAMQPGKPQGFGVHDGTPVFCLPGSPVGMAVSFEMFVRPALRTLGGHREIDRRRMPAPAAASWRSPRGRVQVVPIVFDGDAVRPASADGRHHPITSLGSAEGLAVIPAHIDSVHEGDPVSVMLL